MTADRQFAEVVADLLRPSVVEAVVGEVRQALEAQAERMATPPRLLSVKEVADIAGVHSETIRRKIKRGELPAVTSLGNHLRIRPADLDQFLTPEQGKNDEKK